MFVFQSTIWAANYNKKKTNWQMFRYNSAESSISLILSQPHAFSLSSSPLVHQLQLTGGEWKNAADIISNAQREQCDDHQQKQDPPEAQVLHKLLPSGSKARQHTLAALKVRVQERVTLHGTETHRAVMKQLREFYSLALLLANVNNK